MKIAIVTQSYYPRPGGVTEVVHHSARELRRLGHDVKIITARCLGPNEPDPHVIRIGRNVLVPMNGALVNMTVGLDITAQLRRIFDRERFDIVHTHCPLVPTLPLAAIAAIRPGQRIVGTFHAAAESNLAYRLFRGPLSRRAARLDRRLAVSEAARRFASRYFPGEYEIVPNGVDCGRFRPGVPAIQRFRDGRFNILFVGRLDPRKGAPYLCRALPLIARELPRGARLIVVGERGIRSAFCARPGDLAGAEIVWVGRVAPETLPRYYATADLFCSPAVGRESFGIVLLEAMAAGTPVVASDIAGYRAVVDNGVEGLLVPPRSPDAIAKAVLSIAGNDELRARFAEAGRMKALGYDWSIVSGRLEEIYREVVFGAGDGARDRARVRASV